MVNVMAATGMAKLVQEPLVIKKTVALRRTQRRVWKSARRQGTARKNSAVRARGAR